MHVPLHHCLPGRRGRPLLLLALSQALPATGAGDGAPAPLSLRNLSPLYANLGVPVMDTANWRAAAGAEAQLQWQIASHALRASGDGSRLELDGETQRLDLRLAYRAGARWRLHLNLPWVRHSGGRLDRLIDGWHDLWGLPDGPRRRQPRDRLNYRLDAAGGGWSLARSGGGFGDLEFGADLALYRGAQWSLSALASIRLPTGDRDDFSGGAAGGAAAGLRASRAQCLAAALHCHLQFGVSYQEDSPLDPRVRRWSPFYGFSLAWRLTPAIALLAQLEGQGAVYRDAALAAEGAPLFGALGLRWTPGAWQLEALFTEDLKVGSAPDVSFQLGIRRGF